MNIFIMKIYISDIIDTYTNQESPIDDNGVYKSPNFSSHRHTPSDTQTG